MEDEIIEGPKEADLKPAKRKRGSFSVPHSDTKREAEIKALREVAIDSLVKAEPNLKVTTEKRLTRHGQNQLVTLFWWGDVRLYPHEKMSPEGVFTLRLDDISRPLDKKGFSYPHVWSTARIKDGDFKPVATGRKMEGKAWDPLKGKKPGEWAIVNGVRVKVGE